MFVKGLHYIPLGLMFIFCEFSIKYIDNYIPICYNATKKEDIKCSLKFIISLYAYII